MYRRRNCWVNIWTFRKDPTQDRVKTLIPEIDCGKDRGRVLTPKLDRKIDRYKLFRIEIGFFKKQAKLTKKGGKIGYIKKYTLKIELSGNYLTFRNRLKKPKGRFLTLKKNRKRNW